MNTLVFGWLKRLSSAFNVTLGRTGQRTNRRAFDFLGDFIDRPEVAVRCDGKASFDNVNFQIRQRLGHTHFFIKRHRCTWGLFPITQGGVKNDNAIVVCTSHCLVS